MMAEQLDVTTLRWREREVNTNENRGRGWSDPKRDEPTYHKIKDLTDAQLKDQIENGYVSLLHQALLMEQGFRLGLEFARQITSEGS